MGCFLNFVYNYVPFLIVVAFLLVFTIKQRKKSEELYQKSLRHQDELYQKSLRNAERMVELLTEIRDSLKK